MRENGIEGLKTRSGRGASRFSKRLTLRGQTVVAAHRQKLSIAREELEQALGKSFSQDTLKRFVKKTLINESKTSPQEPCPHLYELKVQG